MCVIVTFFNLRLYYKELEKKKDGDNENRDAKEKEEKKKEKWWFSSYIQIEKIIFKLLLFLIRAAFGTRGLL